MYKFTNGIVVFDEKTRDAYIKAGMRLEELKVKVEDEENALVAEFNSNGVHIKKEVIDENNSNDGTIKKKPRRSNKQTK